MKGKREKSPPEAVAANTKIKQEIYELAHAELSAQAETDAEIAPLIQKVAATSMAEIDRLLAKLEGAKNYLQSEGRRIELEMARYMNLTQMASTTAKVISDAVSQWHPARNEQKSNTSKATPASTEDDTGVRTSGHHGREHETKVTWEDVGCPAGPGTYAFKDGTVDVTQQELSIWIDHPGARFIVRSFRPLTGKPQYALGGYELPDESGTLVDDLLLDGAR